MTKEKSYLAFLSEPQLYQCDLPSITQYISHDYCYALNSDDIYDILALSEEEYSGDSQDDIYDILALSDDEYSGDSQEYQVEDATEGSFDFTEGIEDIDDATSAMAENVNQLLGIDDELKELDVQPDVET